MKRNITSTLVILLLFTMSLFSQTIKPKISFFCNSKQRVYIVFPSIVKVVDISNIIIKYEIINDNTVWFVLNVPDADDNIVVNGMIITDNGEYFPIEIRKTDKYLDKTTIAVPTSDSTRQTNSKTQDIKYNKVISKEESFFISRCNFINDLKETSYNDGKYDYNILNLMNLIAVDDSFVYIRLLFTNESNINYNVDFYGLLITTNKNLKNVTTAEKYIDPVYVYNNIDVIKCDKNPVKSILVYRLFTLKNNQNLNYFMKEKNGGRDMLFKIKPKELLKNSYNLNKNNFK